MNKLKLTISGLAVLAVVLMCSSFSQAQNRRAFVKTTGDDNNNCSFATPCRTFQRAFNAVKAAGTQPEVDALDSGDFSNAQSTVAGISGTGVPGTCTVCTLTLDLPVTIDGTGNLVSLSGGEFFNPPTDAVTVNMTGGNSLSITILRGITINGGHHGGTGGVLSSGIVFRGAGSLVIERCSVSQFGRYGIDFQPSGSGFGAIAGDLYVRDTELTNNEQAGLFAQSANTNTARGSLDNTRFSNNGAFGSGVGLFAAAHSAINVSDSLFATNGLNGILAQSTTTTTCGFSSPACETVNATNCYINGNFVGVAALGQAADTSIIRIASDDIFDNSAALGLGINCTISSFGTNRIAGNGANNGPPNNFVPLQ